MTREPRELRFSVNGLTLRGLCWGEPGQRPVLALHGWLDNAASFVPLAQHLPECQLLALDLTGHGRSDRRSADASYQIWDDLPEVLGVLEQMGWQDFDLLGHSRGAIIAGLLAASQPGRVQRLVMMDALMPRPLPAADFPNQLRDYLRDKPRLLARADRIYPDMAAAIAAREAGGLGAEAARLIAERNLKPCADGVAWTTDPRLRGASAAKLTQEQVEAVLQGLGMPVLLLLAEDGHGKVPIMAEIARDNIPELQLQYFTGGHHFHMEGDVAAVAQALSRFLQLPVAAA